MAVGVFIKKIGEWHGDISHGICKTEYYDGEILSGQYKNGFNYGYHSSIYPNVRASYYQFKNGYENGYGIKA
jgi:hypothetical protein